MNATAGTASAGTGTRDALPNAWGDLTLRVGDLGFTVKDHPVRIVAIGEPLYGDMVPLAVEYLDHNGRNIGTDICSAELAPETHAESDARMSAYRNRVGAWPAWPAYRRAAGTDLRAIVGIAYPDWHHRLTM